jgi:hypothetical protein
MMRHVGGIGVELAAVEARERWSADGSLVGRVASTASSSPTPSHLLLPSGGLELWW